MMIEDEELRRLYQTTASGRIQALNAGLLETPSVPEAARLEALRREAHSLKGDSRVMGLEDIGALAHHVEIVIKDLQQQVIEWRSPLTDRLDDALQAIAQLVEAATTGVAVEVDAPRVGANLQAAMVTAAPDAAVSDTVVSDAVVSDAVVPDAAEAGLAVTGERGKAKGHDIHEPASLSSRFVVDSDVRSLYGAASERRLQTLVQTLEALSQNPDEPSTLATFRGEAQGLKGDAQEVGQGAIAAIAHTFETIANRLMSEKNELTFSLQSSLWRGLQLIEQLVSVAVTEPSSEPSSEQSSEPLSGGASTEPSAEDLTQLFTELEAQIAQSHRPPSGLGEPGDIATATDLIADNELRDIYKDTSEARLQRLEASLLQLEKEPHNGTALQSVIRETHGLKGDAQSTGVSPVATLAEGMEIVLGKIQRQEIALNNELNNAFRESLMAMGALVQNATMGTANAANVTQLSQNLLAIASQAGPPEVLLSPAAGQNAASQNADAQNANDQSEQVSIESQIDGFFSDHSDLVKPSAAGSPAFAPVGAAPAGNSGAIEDDELRDVYRTVSAERLQRLELGLGQLERQPTDPDAIAALLRETHSLKGDARSVDLDSVASLAHGLESLFVGLRDHTLSFSADLSDLLYQGVDAIAQLIDDAITGTSNAQVNTPRLLQQLQDVALPPSLTPSTPAPSQQPLQPGELSPLPTPPLPTPPPPHSPTPGPSAIEDDELREVYRVASAERLQTLELGLVQLENQPDSPNILAELLREAHSLKGDARSVGLAHVGSLAHAIESILVSIQNKTLTLAGELGDLLYEGLDAIAQRIEEAITGIPAEAINANAIDTEQLLIDLRAASPALTEASEQADLSATLLSTSLLAVESDELATLGSNAADGLPAGERQAANEPYKIETIRVQTRDLDTLAAQTEQLTLARIQTAQTTAKMLELVNLWGQWRTYRNTNPSQQPAETNPYEAPLDTLISKLRIATQENSFRLDLISQDVVKQVQTLRLLPIENVLRIFPRVVRDLARQQSKSVELITEGGETTADKRILEDIQDSLMHLVRNALDHGIETPEEREAAGKAPTAKLWIRSYQSPNSIVIEVADDGRGLDVEQIKQTAIRRKLHSADELADFSNQQIQDLIFVPGFSTRSFTTEISGRGVGLDVVRNQIERLKGNVQIESTPGGGCMFRLQISTQLATANVVFIKVRGITHALPIEFLQTTMRVSRDDIVTVDGRDTITWNDATVPIIDLFDVLELGNSPAYQPPTEPVPDSQKACLLLKVGDEMGAFLVDRLLDTQEVVFKPQSVLLKRIRNVTGSTILGNGEICTILNPPDLVKSIQRQNEVVAFAPPEESQVRKPLILLVEDSPPVRIQEKRLFENAGYEVVTAENGLEGYKLLRAGDFDAVVSDIEMPELDGLGLVSKIRQHPEYEELPIVLVTTLSSEEDRQKGADAGANAYIVKGKFNQEVLLETLGRLI